MKYYILIFYFLISVASFTFSLELKEKFDYSSCSCDLIQGFCDSNCCCDPDCSALLNIIPIEKCGPNITNAIPQGCRLNQTTSDGSTGYKQVTVDNPDWGCLYSISDTSSFYYNVPSLLKDLTSLNDAINTLKSDDTTSSSTSSTIGSSSLYKKGELIYVLYETVAVSIKSYFNLPGLSSLSSSCQDISYIKFLVDRSASCVRSFNTGQDPTLFSMFKASNFYNIAVYPSPAAANDGTTAVNTSCSNNNCAAILDPKKDTTSYIDLVNSVAFTITYSDTTGAITNVSATITTTTIPIASTSLIQTFSVNFKSDVVYSGIMYPRSGNPGYLMGKPVIGGDAVTIVTNPATETTARIIRVNRDSNLWFTVVGGGICNELSGKRRSVMFGVNSYSSCYIELGSSDTFDCYQKNFEILQILKGTTLPSHLAIWGDSSPDKIGDWVPLLVTDPTVVRPVVPVIGSKDQPCETVVTGANIDIIYAKVGIDKNPQAKILGAKMTFVTGPIQYRCSGLACIKDSKLKVPIATSVRFIDGSDSVTVFEKAKPVYLTRLPYDFFYPFLLSQGCSDYRFNLSLLIMSLVSSIYLLS